MDSEVASLKHMIDEANRIVAFTGAGISTESGIPDFRSPTGIWSQASPIAFDAFVRSEEARRESWRRKIEIDRDMADALPNRGHRAVARLVEAGKVFAVITQNIDNLHQKSGIPEDRIIELHGNGSYASCLSCGQRMELAPIKAAFEARGTLPACASCGGLVKTATISFGQALPESALRRARDASLSCDLMLVLGSSLVVYPAAGFPPMARQNGARLAIVNREPTGLDNMADLVLKREIGATLGEAVDVG